MKAVVVKLPIEKCALFLNATAVFMSVCAAVCLHSAAVKRLVPIYSVETAEPAIALTFDCAWTDSDLNEIAEILSENEIAATFFVTGEFAERYPDALKALHQSGHEIGNHSDTHPHVNRLSREELLADTARCNEKIQAAIGTQPQVYRTPYGEYNNTVLSALGEQQLPVIQWDCDSRDWQPSATVDSIVQNVKTRVKAGSILLFHVDAKPKATADALRTLLPALKAEGYAFKRVSDLIYKEHFTIDQAGVMRKDE